MACLAGRRPRLLASCPRSNKEVIIRIIHSAPLSVKTRAPERFTLAAVVDAAVDVGAAVAGAKGVVCEATLARSAPYIIRKNRNTRYMFRRRLMEQLLLCNLSKIRKRVHIHLIYLYDSDLLIINFFLST